MQAQKRDKEGRTRDAGEQAGKKLKASDWSSGKRCSVRQEHVWELQKILDGETGCVRLARARRRRMTLFWSLHEEMEKALAKCEADKKFDAELLSSKRWRT